MSLHRSVCCRNLDREKEDWEDYGWAGLSTQGSRYSMCVFGVPPAVCIPVLGNRTCGCGVVFARGRLERGSLQISSQLGLLTG